MTSRYRASSGRNAPPLRNTLKQPNCRQRILGHLPQAPRLPRESIRRPQNHPPATASVGASMAASTAPWIQFHPRLEKPSTKRMKGASTAALMITMP